MNWRDGRVQVFNHSSALVIFAIKLKSHCIQVDGVMSSTLPVRYIWLRKGNLVRIYGTNFTLDKINVTEQTLVNAR